MNKPRLNIIGPGRLGRSLGRLLHMAAQVEIGALIGRHPASTTAARDFIGAGTVSTFDSATAAHYWLIATPDDAIAAAAANLGQSGRLRSGDTVLHCSGALASGVMAPLRYLGMRIASVHPLKSFADPATAVTDFAGTFCACEGEATAVDELIPMFEAIGGRCTRIAAEHKLLYHAAAVLACNHLVALMDGALRCLENAGIAREPAWRALQPLIAGTLANIDRRGTQQALTGPVARGDLATLRAEIDATHALDPDIGAAYRSLSLLALQLAPPGLALTREDLNSTNLPLQSPLPTADLPHQP